MKYLLDVNILVALAWWDHPAHAKVTTWMEKVLAQPGVVFLTVPMVRLGFVRVSLNTRRHTVTPAHLGEMLEGLLTGLGERHRAVADDAPGTVFPSWCKRAAQTTDAHLLALAAMHGAKLATFDAGIPGALLIG